MHTAISPEACARKIAAARRIAVLTGAGLSTAAGIPDFRGPNGLYVTRAYDPEKVFEIHAFDRDPAPFYQFSRDFLSLLDGIRPTFTHTFLAQLERDGRPVTLITQNIDGLHQRAGSQNVLPIHGDYETAHCRRCGRSSTGADLRQGMKEMDVPVCTDCGGVIKPDVVFFGEPVRHLPESVRAAEDSDLMLVLGSSLTVYPAAGLPLEAGGDVVIVNQGDVGLRPGRNIFLADVGLDDFFRAVAAAIPPAP